MGSKNQDKLAKDKNDMRIEESNWKVNFAEFLHANTSSEIYNKY